MMISVQQHDFDHATEYQALRDSADNDGAIVTFTGLVRDFNCHNAVSSIKLEHYPGMTEKSLMSICSLARERWELGQIRVIHRVGVIDAKEQIVFVGVSSTHRAAAFEAAQFIMDHLKTQAPFWKKESTANGVNWVEAKESDEQAANKWSG